MRRWSWSARPPPSTAVAGAGAGALRLRDTGAPVAGGARGGICAGIVSLLARARTRSTRARALKRILFHAPKFEGLPPARAAARSALASEPPPLPTHTTDAVAGMSLYFQHHGRCVANMRDRPINMDEPDQLLNLDTMSKQSTGKNVETMHHGRFTTMPRKFVGDEATARSNGSIPSRLFLDPYHVSDGNLISYNFRMKQYQRGGQTCLAARNQYLKFEVERFGKTDPASRARSKYVEPPGGRFVPPLKPNCGRDKGPDPYGTAKHAQWLIPSTGYAGGMGASKKTTPKWSTYALSKAGAAPP